MQIHEIESKTRLTKKSIRYYEEEGLISPKRNALNDYREYDENDLNTLKLIKFLRELNIPTNDIKKLHNNTLTLEECMNDRIKKIDEEQKNYDTIKNMCLEISKNKDTYQNINISKYSLTMNILNKKGFTMKDTSKKHTKKIMGAIISSLSFSFIFIFIISLISYFQFTESDKIPWFIYWAIMILLAFPILSIIVNLIKRIIEIKGGEEDEASKY